MWRTCGVLSPKLASWKYNCGAMLLFITRARKNFGIFEDRKSIYFVKLQD